MANIKIYIESESKTTPESNFLTAILEYLGIGVDKYEIVPTSGYTNLMNPKMPYLENLRSNSDAGGINIVIFDADTDKNGGGFEKRRNELIKRRDELGRHFHLFLWPNNKDDGDVEVLIESIARKDLYPEFFECFSKYEHCMSKRKKENGDTFYTMPNRKGKLYTYFNALPISNTKKKQFGKGNWQWQNKDIWDFESSTLEPIKVFLKEHIK